MKKEMNFFVKSHGLGNEYVVIDEENCSFPLNTETIQKICNVNFGIGSDGILLKVPSTTCDFGLRIFNPDGSEAEKSGNGLRIFSKYLYDYDFTSHKEYTIETPGGDVVSEIISTDREKAKDIRIFMGTADFNSRSVPAEKHLTVDGKRYDIHCVSIGNPHCIILKDILNKAEILRYGSLIENHRIFPNRTNVQFVQVINRQLVEILIWERGAGYTLASGSSSCAAVSVLRKLNLVDSKVSVSMPGGMLEIEVSNDWKIKMTGETREIISGYFSPEFIEDLKKKKN
jgi:diaminopimelate epimerase